MTKEKIIIIVFLLIGFLYRWYFASISETKVIYDVASYTRMAHEILNGQITTDCCDQNVGYGMFLAVIYKIFGMDNLRAVQLVQIIMDLVTAGLIYLTVYSLIEDKRGSNKTFFGDVRGTHSSAKSLYPSSLNEALLPKVDLDQKVGQKQGFKTPRNAYPSPLFSPSLWVFILYIINPFTASYVGLRMPETWTIFMMAVIAFILTRKSFYKKEYWWFLLGLLLGLLLFARMAMSVAVFAFIVFSAILFFKRFFRVYFLVIVLSGFLIGSSYTLISDFYNFHKISLTPPYSLGLSQLYYNFYRDRYPELFVDFPKVNATFWALQLETHRTYYTDIPSLKNKYQALFWQKVKGEWPLLIRNTVRNIFWLWDKDHLSYYTDPYYPADVWPLRIINLFSIGFFVFGIISFIGKKGKEVLKNPLFIFTLINILNITFLFSLVSNETRHSIYFYGLLYLWAGYGVSMVGILLRSPRPWRGSPQNLAEILFRKTFL